MAQTLAPEVRSQFAQRLKNLRTQRGFDRARYFAKSLGIEENRYTRYERAEVEPSLTLIHKMCETLRVSPNELLGFADLRHLHAGGVPGLAEASLEEIARTHGGEADGKGGGPRRARSPGALRRRRWPYATSTAASPRRQADPAGGACARPARCSAAFRREPFDTVAEILNDAALKDVDAKHKARLAELIQAFTEQRQRAAPPGGAR